MNYLLENCDVFVFDNETYLVSKNKLYKMVDGKPVSIDVVDDVKSIDCSDKLLILVGDSCFVCKSVDNPEWKKNWIVKKDLINVFCFNEDLFILVQENNSNFKMKALIKNVPYECSLFLDDTYVELVDKSKQKIRFKQSKYTTLLTKASISVTVKIDFIYDYSYSCKNGKFDDEIEIIEVGVSSDMCTKGPDHYVVINEDYEDLLEKKEKTIDEYLEIDYNKLLPNNGHSDNSVNSTNYTDIMSIYND